LIVIRRKKEFNSLQCSFVFTPEILLMKHDIVTVRQISFSSRFRLQIKWTGSVLKRLKIDCSVIQPNNCFLSVVCERKTMISNCFLPSFRTFLPYKTKRTFHLSFHSFVRWENKSEKVSFVFQEQWEILIFFSLNTFLKDFFSSVFQDSFEKGRIRFKDECKWNLV